MTGDAMREVIAKIMARAIQKRAAALDPDVTWEEWVPEATAALAAITAAPASARLALARAITPDTHAVVPVEATNSAMDAFGRARIRTGSFHASYRAMIAAARGADATKEGSDDGR